jgi:hypothetical protein
VIDQDLEERLVVSIEPPDDATDDEIQEMIGEVIELVDELHKALGGGGLVVESIVQVEDE